MNRISFKKTLLFFLVIFSLFSQFSFAEISMCTGGSVKIDGPNEVGRDKTNYFSVKEESLTGEKNSSGLDLSLSTTFTIFYQGKQNNQIYNQTGILYYSFPKKGLYEIVAFVKSGSCFREATKFVRVYDNMFFYIGNFLQDFNFDILKNIQQKDILVGTIFLNSTEKQETITNVLSSNMSYIEQSQAVFLNTSNFSVAFDILQEIQSKGISLSGKKIVLVNSRVTK